MFSFGDSDEKVLADLRSDFKFRIFEKMIRQFFTESLEVVLLKQEYVRDGSKTLSTIGDIAKRFKVSKATVHNWMARESLKGLRLVKTDISLRTKYKAFSIF
jgi:translation elongation factor EF-Ts